MLKILFVLSILFVGHSIRVNAQDLMGITRSAPGCPDSTNSPRTGRGFFDTGERSAALDINGDGIPDPGFYFEADGLTDKYIVVDGSLPARRWEFTLWKGAAKRPPTHRLVGYYNLDGTVDNTNPKEPVFAVAGNEPSLSWKFEDIVISSYTMQSTQPLGIIAILIGLFDANGDGKIDIMTANCANPSGSSIDLWTWK